MIELLIVACGGAAGAVLRYLTVLAAVRLFGATWLPAGTLAVNLSGCFLAGAAFCLVAALGLPELHLLLMTGILGSYTTFSTFAMETWFLLRQSAVRAAGYLSVQVAGGISAAAAGFLLARLLMQGG